MQTNFYNFLKTREYLYLFYSAALKQQQNSPDWGEHVRKILATGINRPKKGVNVGDHPPITPMKHATPNELDGDSWRLYDYITRHFIATVNIASLVRCSFF